MKETRASRTLILNILGLLVLVIGFTSQAYGQAAPNPLFGMEDPPGTSTSDTTPQLRWTSVSGVSSYAVEVRDVETGELVVDIDGRNATFYTSPNLVRGRIYVWNVRGCNGSNCGDFSASSYFNVTGTAPDAPNPLFGSDTFPGPEISDTTPQLQWSSVSNVSSYDVVVRNTATDEIVASIDGRSSTSYTVPTLLGGQTYRWNVRACRTSGCGIYSESFYFHIVESLPGVPNLLLGSRSAPGPSLTDTTPQLRWSSVSGATSYDINVRDLTSNQLVVNVDDRTGTSYTTPALIKGRSFRWNARACNSAGCGAYSSSNYFRIAGTVVNTPQPLFGSPDAPGTQTSDTTPQLRWTTVSGATFYDVDVYNASSGQLVVSIDGRTSTSYSTPELPGGRSYRWNVRACNNLGCSNPSLDAYFIVGSRFVLSPITVLLLDD